MLALSEGSRLLYLRMRREGVGAAVHRKGPGLGGKAPTSMRHQRERTAACARSRRLNRRFRTALTLLLAVVTTAVLVSCSSGGAASSSTRTHAPARATSHPTATQTAEPATFLGADGVESRAIIAENRRPGTSAWRITNPGAGMIEGFADHNYAQQGDTVGLYVSTDQSSFVATAYRMGWYGGAGAREVWQSAPLTGVNQPACPVTPTTNMVSCDNWTRSVSVTLTSAFVPGDYLIKLTANDNAQSYIQLTVWQPTSDATYLLLNRSMVEQGWNTFGGYDYYQGTGPCILDHDGYPPCNRARVVSFDRPYAGDGSNDFLTSEYPIVEFMEQEGLDVTYCTDICLSEHPTFLLQHKALVDTDHDETWTNSEREAVLNAANAGVNMAFFGAATLVRHARLEPSPLGADREEVDYRDSSEDPLDAQGTDPADVTGNTWSSPPASWDAESFLGQIYSGYLHPGVPNASMTVYDANSWFFQGTGLGNGAQIPSVINSDIDHLDPSGPMPQNLQVLAHSAIPLSRVFTNQGTWGGNTYSDVTYYTNPAGAGIFDSGDNIWVNTLLPCPATAPDCPAVTMRQLTANVLHLFGQGPAGHTQPSQANWQSVTPAGS